MVSPHMRTKRSTRERLLTAAAHLLSGNAPDAVTVRAIAREAGVAIGALYSYFSDRDDLLLAVVLDRFRTQAEQAQELLTLAGSATVEANLVAFGRATVDGAAISMARVMTNRPELATRVRLALNAEGQPGFSAVEDAIAEYLGAEQALGRLADGANPAAAAALLVSAWHQSLHRGDQDQNADVVHDRVDRFVTTLMRGLNPTRNSSHTTRLGVDAEHS